MALNMSSQDWLGSPTAFPSVAVWLHSSHLASFGLVFFLVVLWCASLGAHDPRSPSLSGCEHIWYHHLPVTRQKTLATRILPRCLVSKSLGGVLHWVWNSWRLQMHLKLCLSRHFFLKQVWGDAKMLAPQSWNAPIFFWTGLQDILNLLHVHRGALRPCEHYLCECKMCCSISFSVVVPRQRWWRDGHMMDRRPQPPSNKQCSRPSPPVLTAWPSKGHPMVLLLLFCFCFAFAKTLLLKFLDSEEFLIWQCIRKTSLVPTGWGPKATTATTLLSHRSSKPQFWVEVS